MEVGPVPAPCAALSPRGVRPRLPFPGMTGGEMGQRFRFLGEAAGVGAGAVVGEPGFQGCIGED